MRGSLRRVAELHPLPQFSAPDLCTTLSLFACPFSKHENSMKQAIMSRRILLNHTAALRRTYDTTTTTTHAFRARPITPPLLAGRRCYATERKDDGKLDFKGQLWESTTQRVQKEREEQERFAKTRMARAGGRSGAGLAFTACMKFLIHPPSPALLGSGPKGWGIHI